jgi:hypothetical protein
VAVNGALEEKLDDQDAGRARSTRTLGATAPRDAAKRAGSVPAPRTAEEARGQRDAWRALARDHAGTPRGDEARVRAIEAGLLAWRLGRDRADLEAAQAEARAYLAETGAPQAERVRKALAGAASPAP